MTCTHDPIFTAKFHAIKDAAAGVTVTRRKDGLFLTDSGFITGLLTCDCEIKDPDQYSVPITTPKGNTIHLCCHIMRVAKEVLPGVTLKSYQELVDTTLAPPYSDSLKGIQGLRNAVKVQTPQKAPVAPPSPETLKEIQLWERLSERADKVEFCQGQAAVEQYRDGLRNSVETIPGKKQINGYLVTPTACGCPAAQMITKEGTVRLHGDLRICKHSYKLRKMLGQNVESLVSCLNPNQPIEGKGLGWIR